MKRILVTGAGGQIGSWLVPRLRELYGAPDVMATDLKVLSGEVIEAGPFQVLDATDAVAVGEAVAVHKADTVYHLAAILSATGERDPRAAWKVNMSSLEAVLEVARERRCAVFTPSSIGVFGPDTPKNPTPQDTVMRPATMYGITKVAGELLCDYYHRRFGVDTRGVRFPGLISYGAPPGGGTTDWAVDIFYQAVKRGTYTCFLGPDTQLDMMYMPDAVDALVEIMEADPDRLVHRNAFNVTAMQLTPEGLTAEIRKHLPDFSIAYEIDPVRQAIAESWPDRIDDSAAREEWDWSPSFDASAMTADMLHHLSSE
ncbi:MAG: NAD-dependent epimerase/dehydratase family protein [Gemmatimonadetes bacterium]|nr:NAD-dependent epimerase/dehydratase family protein [Gemmatimonadota bacterium]MDA1103120.1 NAD-dependent epimerase/dehydratase family protein [Gemmatimonadota bacterium]